MGASYVQARAIVSAIVGTLFPRSECFATLLPRYMKVPSEGTEGRRGESEVSLVALESGVIRITRITQSLLKS